MSWRTMHKRVSVEDAQYLITVGLLLGLILGFMLGAGFMGAVYGPL